MRNWNRTSLISAVLLATLAGTANATTYYVSNSGNDTWEGNITKPWKTIDFVNTQTFDPGDTILFEADGVWWGADERLVISDSGNGSLPSNVITVGSYGSGEKPIIGYDADVEGLSWSQEGSSDAWWAPQSTEVLMMNEWIPHAELHAAAGFSRMYEKAADIDGVKSTEGSWFWDDEFDRLYVHLFDDANPNTAGHGLWVNTSDFNGAAVDVSGESYIVVQDLHVVTNKSGVRMDSSDHITVKDCRLSGNRQATLATKSVGGAKPDEIVIRDNDARYNGNGYKFKEATNLTIFGNKAFYTIHRHNPGDDGANGEGVGFNDCDDIEVYDNELTENIAGIATWSPDGGVFTNFSIHHNYLYGDIDKGIQIGHDNREDDDGLYDGDLYIFHNILWLDTAGVTSKGIFFRAETKETLGSRPSYLVWNNTIKATQGVRLGVDTAEQNPQHKRIDHVLKNNLFYDCKIHILDVDETIVTGSEADRNYNMFYKFGANNSIYYDGTKYDDTTNKKFSDYKTVSGEEQSKQDDNEQLVNPPTDFRPDTGVAVIDAGTDPPSDIPYDPDTDKDFYDQAIDTPSMGAAEPTTP